MKQAERPKMSRDRVLDAALELVNREGIAGLSMRKLGAELGLEAMTLYYYVPNKEAVLDGLVERVVSRTMARMTDLIGRPSAWPDWLRAVAVAFRLELQRHPRLISLIATRPVMTPDAFRAVERAAATLCEAGFSPTRALHVINTVTTFVIGHLLAEVGDTPGHEESVPDTQGLAGRLDPAEFPYLCAAIDRGLGQPDDHASRFDYALDALVIGFSASLQANENEPTRKPI